MKNKSLGVQATSSGSKPDAHARKKLSISVKKLREVAPPTIPECSTSSNDGEVYIPPALLANRTVPHKSRTVSNRGAIKGLINRYASSDSVQLASYEKDGQSSHMSSKAYPHETAVWVPSELKEEAVRQKATDIFISQYNVGQKEAVRAAFKQRIQNAPVFKEVKVHLLNNMCLENMDGSKSTEGEKDSATTIAAATAAAIASTAPLLKVQSDLEAKVSSVSEMLSKLEETDKRLQRVAEQQTRLKSQQSEEPPCHQRVGELEKQMSVFLEQRIQHLENVQQQQMNIQSHLISSALNSGSFQTVKTAPFRELTKQAKKTGRQLSNQTTLPEQDLFSSSVGNRQGRSRQFEKQGIHRQNSPLKTPAPRRYAPVPVSKDANISQKIAKKEQNFAEKENVSYGRTLGGGKFLEQILKAQESPLNPCTSWMESTSRAMPWSSKNEHRSWVPQTDQDLNPIERTVKKADDVLHDLGQLKREMHDILQDAKEWKLDMNNFMKTTSNFRETGQVKDYRPPPQPPDSLGSSSKAFLKVPLQAERKDLSELQHLSKSSILQSTKASNSILRDAENILRTVRKNKKLLEENLEAIIRSKDGSALHAFIDELTADRDVLEEIRIRKTVDEWIKTISLEIKDEMARKDDLISQQSINSKKASRARNVTDQSAQRIPVRRLLPIARPAPNLKNKDLLKTKMEPQNEDYLSQIYGRPIYQGHRSTLKQSPYLRFNSPPPKTKPPRPKLIERVKGTKLKSNKTQTSQYPQSEVISPKKPGPMSVFHQEPQYLFNPIKEICDASGPLEGHLIPMAIPLGQKQINHISPQSSEINIGEFHPVTVTASVLPPPPPPKPRAKNPQVTIIEMKSEKKDPPKLTVQMLPSIDIDSISNDSASENHISFPTKAAIQSNSEDCLLQEEEPELPGANLFGATDVIPEEDGDGISEPFLHFNRQGDIELPKYNGPPFPPVAPAPQLSADVLDEIIEKRETLENKLASWVEQEVMARIISKMYPAQKEVMPNISLSDSEESQAVSSDIVECAGAEGFQLFVDANIPVDSEMIRRFVNEALAERVAVMLGERESQKVTSATVTSSLPQLPEKEIVLPTPVVTPEATPPQSPPPLKELFEIKTPESSLSDIEINEGVGNQEVMGAIAVAVSPVHTPAVTPVVTPPRVATPSPPLPEQIPARGLMERKIPPSAWGDAELPLEEEKPSPQSEEEEYNPGAVIMSVAKHEEPDSLILPASLKPPESHHLLPPEPRPPSPSVETSSSGSSEESSATATETETADRPISEGEVLYSCGQLLAAKAFSEGVLSFPNFSDSLASTLHDTHEMDYDPPSEGQVIQRLHKGHHKSPLLSLFSKLHEVPLVSQEEICQSEDVESSAGELSEGQRPRLTKAAENFLMGHSIYMGQATNQVSNKLPQRMAPPGQHDHVAGNALGGADVTQGPMSIAELKQPDFLVAYGNSRPTSHLDDTLQTKTQETLHTISVKSRVICVKPKIKLSQHKGSEITPHFSSPPAPAKVSVKVPSADTDDKTLSSSSIDGSSDSSGADTF